MDDRAYLAQALFERLRSDSASFCVLGDTRRYPEEVGPVLQLALPRATLADAPRMLSAFCREFDLQLVQILRPEPASFRFVLAWSDDIGRPRFMGVELCSDYYLGGRLLLRAGELLGRRRPAFEPNGLAKEFEVPAADMQFIHHLLGRLHACELSETDGEFLSGLWEEDTAGVNEAIGRFWPVHEEARRIVHAARHNEWSAVQAHALPLQRALRPRRGILASASSFGRNALQRPGALIAFVGEEGSARSSVMQHVLRDLAPAFSGRLRAIERPQARSRWLFGRPDLYVLFDLPHAAAGGPDPAADETVRVDTARPLSAMVGTVERAILQWLERRVERRYPGACVGENSVAARLLQWATRTRVPGAARLVNWALGCAVRCRVRSPVLMPEPSGIFIDREVRLGRRVTVMQQVTIGWRHSSDRRTPVIEDNVFIGAGAKILGPVHIGRGATVGANAVVTRDVPSHCTVVGANRILGQRDGVVVPRRREQHGAVVNM
jgi:serine O-acetyltransferase